MNGEKMARIVIVEDDNDLRMILAYSLKKAGFVVDEYGFGVQALNHIREVPPDLVILDLQLPDMDGTRVCQRLREEKATTDLPVIMLTARTHEEDILKGLNLGADDYITKPYNPKILIARVEALLRRSFNATQTNEVSVRWENFELYPNEPVLAISGSKLTLTPKEYYLLKLLLSRPGWTFSREQILNNSSLDFSDSSERSVDVLVTGLRKKLGSSGNRLHTVRGFGYKLQ